MELHRNYAHIALSGQTENCLKGELFKSQGHMGNITRLALDFERPHEPLDLNGQALVCRVPPFEREEYTLVLK